MLRVPVYSGVLKLKNVNKKGLCWQAKIARQSFAHGKALSCCFCRYVYIYVYVYIYIYIYIYIILYYIILLGVLKVTVQFEWCFG